MRTLAAPFAMPTPSLRGIVAPWVTRCLKDDVALRAAVGTFGSPLNILCSEPFSQNIAGFDSSLREAIDQYRIFYARKPNKSPLFVREALEGGIGVDIASDDELVEALHIGYPAHDICVTAALITKPLAHRVIQYGIVTVVENHDQLELLNKVATSQGLKHPILLRLGGFLRASGASPTRLGFTPEVASDVIRDFGRSTYSHLDLRGFHFHINGYTAAPRREAISQTLALVDLARDVGLQPDIIDIGGGFPVNYLQSRAEWENFQTELRRALLGAREPITWNNDGLGMHNLHGSLHGTLDVYPYFNEKPKWFMLRELIYSRLSTGETVANAINRRKLELRIEPGRALLDQCGISVSSVGHRSYDSNGDLCVGLQMNFTQLRSSSADFLVDPILISGADEERLTECFLSGTYCMDRDLIMKRKLTFNKEPKPDDLMCFINTAGYMMHFLQSPGHSFNLAANVVWDHSTGTFNGNTDTIDKGGL